MAKIKHTKNELKAQSDSLRRFARYLPMLLLKKQQLQAEVQQIAARVAAKQEEEHARREAFNSWIRLLSEPADLETMIEIKDARTEEGNIAGVRIPVFLGMDVVRGEPDLFASPSWIDDAADAIQELAVLRAERRILEEQQRMVEEELRTTSQRVNLFEKVKIPECRENIRIIKIFLGDEQTAGVVRGKIAKKRSSAGAK